MGLHASQTNARTARRWRRILPRGKGRSKIHAAKGFGPEKLRDLHSDVLIALTARSLGARRVTSNRADFELIASCGQSAYS